MVQCTKQCFYWIPNPRKYVCRHQDIYPTLIITGDLVNLPILWTGHMADHLKCIFCKFQHVVVVQYTTQCFYWIPHPRKYVCRHQDIYPTLTITGDIVNLAIFGNEHMADHLKCIFCMFQHVVVVQYTKQCFYWIPHTIKYVCRHQDIYPTLSSTRDILNLVIFVSGQAVI